MINSNPTACFDFQLFNGLFKPIYCIFVKLTWGWKVLYLIQLFKTTLWKSIWLWQFYRNTPFPHLSIDLLYSWNFKKWANICEGNENWNQVKPQKAHCKTESYLELIRKHKTDDDVDAIDPLCPWKFLKMKRFLYPLTLMLWTDKSDNIPPVLCFNILAKAYTVAG